MSYYEQEDIFDFVYDFLISENLDEQDVLDIMACVPIDEILEVIELDEDEAWRNRNFDRAVKNVPKNVKAAGGKSFMGVPTDMNTGRKSPSRERKYQKDLGMSKQDPITNYQFRRS